MAFLLRSPRFQAFLNHEAGPKTIHFWAPIWKWGLVGAGLADFNRAPEKISITQSAALATTGVIWSRYCVQIKPVNYNLMWCNVFVAATGIRQVYRYANWKRGQKHAAEQELQLEAPPAEEVDA